MRLINFLAAGLMLLPGMAVASVPYAPVVTVMGCSINPELAIKELVEDYGWELLSSSPVTPRVTYGVGEDSSAWQGMLFERVDEEGEKTYMWAESSPHKNYFCIISVMQ